MASSASKSVSTKKLKEHLQEAQEPFSLGIYLSEREYMMNCLSFTSKTSCCLMSSLTNLKRPCNNGINKKKIADAISFEEDSLLSKHRDGSLLTKVTQAFNLGNLKQKENRLLRRETLSGYAKETRSYTAQHQYYK
ncbi:uncharacterized protein LOC110811370 isoform X2 [Carica papaya]|uniref:uncharacterized protein LOC110811370 isoform X2 n=1 Tax=Carica papaya TaxID=3649 RepID=UPI000B8CC47D|nr:uncharacterized protein LOC110811370 isoform X2 [Carica papaya]